MRDVTSFSLYNLVVIYCLCASEICPDKRSGLKREGLLYISIIILTNQLQYKGQGYMCFNDSVMVKVKVMCGLSTFKGEGQGYMCFIDTKGEGQGYVCFNGTVMVKVRVMCVLATL